MWRARWLGVLVLGCAAAPVPRPKTPPPATTPAPSSKPREASEQLLRYWALGSAPEAVLFADRTGLSQPEGLSALLRAASSAGERLLELPAGHTRCVRTVVERTQAVVLGRKSVEVITLLELGKDGADAVRAACVGNVIPSERIVLEGNPEAYALGPYPIFVIEPEVVLIGERAPIEAALANASSEWVEGMGLGRDEALRLRVRLGDGLATGEATLRTTRDFLGLSARAQLPSDEKAIELESELTAFRAAFGAAGAPAQRDVRQALKDGFSIEREGRALRLSLELPGSPERQAEALDALVAYSATSLTEPPGRKSL